MGLFSKVDDYNLILEKILDSKYFSSNTKSLLLSMVYKIENFYDDYKKVKHIDKTKEEFLSNIVEIIKKYCDNIKLVEPDSEDAKMIKDNNVLALTNEKERSILAYPTEVSLLYAISDIVPKYFYISDTYSFKKQLQRLLVNGYNSNNVEVLTDFNGWSWDINSKQKNNIEDNLIYQNLLILFGDICLDEWLEQNSTKINTLGDIKNKLGKTKYFEYLCKYLYYVSNDKEKKQIEKVLNKKREEFSKMSNKSEYFENIKISKMKYLKEVEKIDKLLNDKDLLMKAYITKNLRLDETKRMASVNTYKKIIQNRREEVLEKISVLTKLMNPTNFVKHKKELEEFVNACDNNISKEDCIIKIQEEFIRFFIWRKFEIRGR